MRLRTLLSRAIISFLPSVSVPFAPQRTHAHTGTTLSICRCLIQQPLWYVTVSLPRQDADPQLTVELNHMHFLRSVPYTPFDVNPVRDQSRHTTFSTLIVFLFMQEKNILHPSTMTLLPCMPDLLGRAEIAS